MADFILTKKAVSDLSEIWNYTCETWSEDQADKYYQMLIDSFKTIAGNPEIGKKYDEIVKHLSGLKVGRHIIFYRIIQRNKIQIEITRILHEKMDLRSRLNK